MTRRAFFALLSALPFRIGSRAMLTAGVLAQYVAGALIEASGLLWDAARSQLSIGTQETPGSIKFPTKAGAAPFGIAMGGSWFGQFFDDVLAWGYNVDSANGGVANPAEPHMMHTLEGDYYEASQGIHAFEWNFGWGNRAAGYEMRALAFGANKYATTKETDTTSWWWTMGGGPGARFEVASVYGSAYVVYPDGRAQWFAPSTANRTFARLHVERLATTARGRWSMASDAPSFWRFDHAVGIGCDADPLSNSMIQANCDVDIIGILNLGTGANRVQLFARDGALWCAGADGTQTKLGAR